MNAASITWTLALIAFVVYVVWELVKKHKSKEIKSSSSEIKIKDDKYCSQAHCLSLKDPRCIACNCSHCCASFCRACIFVWLEYQKLELENRKEERAGYKLLKGNN